MAVVKLYASNCSCRIGLSIFIIRIQRNLQESQHKAVSTVAVRVAVVVAVIVDRITRRVGGTQAAVVREARVCTMVCDAVLCCVHMCVCVQGLKNDTHVCTVPFLPACSFPFRTPASALATRSLWVPPRVACFPSQSLAHHRPVGVAHIRTQYW